MLKQLIPREEPCLHTKIFLSTAKGEKAFASQADCKGAERGGNQHATTQPQARRGNLQLSQSQPAEVFTLRRLQQGEDAGADPGAKEEQTTA